MFLYLTVNFSHERPKGKFAAEALARGQFSVQKQLMIGGTLLLTRERLWGISICLLQELGAAGSSACGAITGLS